MRITKEHVRAFCASIDWPPHKLAKESGVPASSLYRLMSGQLATLSVKNNDKVEETIYRHRPDVLSGFRSCGNCLVSNA